MKPYCFVIFRGGGGGSRPPVPTPSGSAHDIASCIAGPEKLVTTVLGTFCGGILTRRLKLDVTGCVKLTVIARAISLVLKCFNFLLGCDNPPIIGLDAVNRYISSSFNSNIKIFSRSTGHSVELLI